MKYTEKVDLYRLIGEELYRAYRRGALSSPPHYDTNHVTKEEDIGALAKAAYVDPYLKRIEAGENLQEEIQYVLGVIKSTIEEYSRIKKEDEAALQDELSLTISKALGRGKF